VDVRVFCVAMNHGGPLEFLAEITLHAGHYIPRQPFEFHPLAKLR
jgi:hypothetical protein